MDEITRLEILRKINENLNYPEACPLNEQEALFKEYLRSVYIPLKQEQPDYNLILYVYDMVGLLGRLLWTPDSETTRTLCNNSFYLPPVKEFKIFVRLQSRKFRNSYSILERFLRYSLDAYFKDRRVSKGILTRTLESYRPEFEKAIEKYDIYYNEIINIKNESEKNYMPDYIKEMIEKGYLHFDGRHVNGNLDNVVEFLFNKRIDPTHEFIMRHFWKADNTPFSKRYIQDVIGKIRNSK